MLYRERAFEYRDNTSAFRLSLCREINLECPDILCLHSSLIMLRHSCEMSRHSFNCSFEYSIFSLLRHSFACCAKLLHVALGFCHDITAFSTLAIFLAGF